MNPALVPLEAAISRTGTAASPLILEMFDRYLYELMAWRSRVNLTGASSATEIVADHLIDSLVPLFACGFGPGISVVDVGSGAGFPGIPLKIVRPDLHVVLIEASRRRTGFLEHVRHVLALPELEIVWGRAENLALRPGFRDRAGVCVSRAAGALGLTVEVCLPLVKPGGDAVLLRGQSAMRALDDVRPLIATLGGTVRSYAAYQLPGARKTTVALVLGKRVATPPGFPRIGRRLGSTRLTQGSQRRAAES